MNVVMLWLRVAVPVVRDWGGCSGGVGPRRCAGWLGGKAEFPCGLPGGCERRRVAGRCSLELEIPCGFEGGCECRCVAGRWKVVSKFGDGFLWCCGGMCGMICISYKIYPFIWFLFASMSEAFFQKYL